MRRIISIRISWFRLLPVWLLASCSVMLVGAYDQVTDESIQKIQNQVMTTLVKLERNFDNRQDSLNAYPRFVPVYEELAGELASLKLRCQSLPKYDIVIQQVDLVQANLNDLEKYHKLGFKKKEEVEPIRKAFESQFGAMISLQNSLKRKKTG